MGLYSTLHGWSRNFCTRRSLSTAYYLPSTISRLLLCACICSTRIASAQTHTARMPSALPRQAGAMPHLGKGFELLNENRYREAAQEFRAALALDPRLTLRARFPLAVCLFAMGSRMEARKEFEAVRSVVGDKPDVLYYLGRLDLTAARYELASRELRIAAGQPPFPDTDYFLGYACLKTHHLTEAEAWLRKAAELAPDDFRVEERLGLLYRMAGRNQEAQKAFARAATLHQRDLIGNQQALDCMRALQSQPLLRARPVCQQLFHPNDLGDLVSLGTIYGNHGDYAQALEPFRRAAELDAASYEAQYNLGLTYFRLHRYREARKPLMKAVALRPDVFKLNALLGAVLYELGEDSQAFEYLNRAYELNPNDRATASLLFKEALLLARQAFFNKQYPSSVQYLSRAAAIQPANPKPHQLLARVYAAAGNRASAQKESIQAERLATSKP